VATCAVEEKTEDLLEELLDGCALGMFAHGAEKTFKVRVEVDAAQVANEKIETGASGQAVARDLDIINGTCFVAAIARHPALHHMGDTNRDAWLEENINKNELMR
jgi:hypothetical protein